MTYVSIWTASVDWQDGLLTEGERSVLQVAVRGVIAGVVAYSVASTNNSGRSRRESEANARAYVAVLSGDSRCVADAVHSGNFNALDVAAAGLATACRKS